MPEDDADAKAKEKTTQVKDRDSDDSDSDDSDDERKDYKTTKHAPNDIFDTLLSLVESKERIQHDVKTRRQRVTGTPVEKKNNKQTMTKRRRMK